ncbi:hypothetical protein IAU59_000866 [Kwoniella sp. CBS 9459]
MSSAHDESSTRAEDPAEPKWHPGFTRGDVRFRATDGTLFAVNGQSLAQGSECFKAMLEVPTPLTKEKESDPTYDHCSALGPVADESDIIDIQADSDTLATFRAMLISPVTLRPASTHEATCDLLKLCIKFDCRDDIMVMVKVHLESFSGKLWKTFVLASELDDRSLGQRLLT